jgi:oxygen-dependent protoporphyrinogen oxidase
VDVVVVGAGVAGLTVARTVLDGCPQASVAVLEAADRPGGQVITTLADGYTFEHGATAMMSPGAEVRGILDRLGLGDRIETASAAGTATALWRDGRLNPLPTGLASAARSGLLSVPGKARVLAEPVLGRRRPGPDETIDEFARRRFGPEAARILIGALVQGVTAGDPRSTELAAFSPKLWHLDRAAGRRSLLVTALGQRRAARVARSGAAGSAPVGSAPRGGEVRAVRGTRGRAAAFDAGHRAVAASASWSGAGCGLGGRHRYRCGIRAVVWLGPPARRDRRGRPADQAVRWSSRCRRMAAGLLASSP